MKKLLISDYDQTLYLNDKDIENNKLYINKFTNLGNTFVIATGRSYLDFNNVLNKYKFNYDYAILNHGTTTIDKNNNVIFNVHISNEIIPQIKNALELNNCINYFCCSELDSRVSFKHENLTKINVKYNSKEEAIEKTNFLNNKYGDFIKAYYTYTNCVEIISNKTNKAKAISQLIKYCEGFNKDNIYVIGNGQSDIEMVKEFNGYCMKDSIVELKKISKKEYDSVSSLIKEILEK